MPMCTYYGPTEAMRPTGDNDLDALLVEVRNATGKDWRIDWRDSIVRKALRRPKTTRVYSLIVATIAPEFQVINFYRDGQGWTINSDVTKELIYAYLYGVLGGAAATEGK